jgi:type I restriction enzyme S subunit
MGVGQHTITRDMAAQLRARVVPANSIVYAKIGAALLLNKRRITACACCIDNNMTAYMPDPAKMRTKWAFYWLNIVDFGKVVNPGAVPSLSEGDQAILPIAVPPLIEQDAITQFLDHETKNINALVAEQERMIGLLKEKKQAVISQAVTKGLYPNVPMKDSGVDWLGCVPEHWNLRRIKYFVRSFSQGWSPQCESFPVSSDDEWGVLKVGCVNEGRFNPEENKSLPSDLEPVPDLSIAENDVLISRANTRDLVGRAACVERSYPNLLLCDKLYRLRLDESTCHPKLLVDRI